MNRFTRFNDRFTDGVHIVVMLVVCSLCSSAVAAEIEGFTEPYRTVNVAASDSGIVRDIPVHIGDLVSEGDLVANLDSDLHQIMVEMAQDNLKAEGRLKAAQAKLDLRQSRYNKLVEIQKSGFGSEEEVQRAFKEIAVSKADLQAEHEDLIQRRWELKRLQQQLERRSVRAPVTGFISEILKDPGEFVAPNEPNVVTIVQLDPLLAKFSLKRSHAAKVKVGDEFKVVVSSGIQTKGVVDSISPVMDAQSGTQRIKIRIPNADGKIISGERCKIKLPYSSSDDNTDKMAFDIVPNTR